MSENIDVKQAYQAWSKTYDSNENATRDLDAECLKNADLPLDGNHVLELGAGSGKNTQFLAQHASHVTALDFSPDMLALARKNSPNPISISSSMI